MNSSTKIRILVAPLNWGLGHATRCIPIVKALIENNYEPILASDGQALKLLQKEFQKLESIELPSYNITYASKAERFKLKLIQDTPHFLNTIKKEKAVLKNLVRSVDIKGIISDNRFGVRHIDIPSVFVTHQLKVLSGNTTWLSTALHQKIISKFQECWVPDESGEPNLSGKLGHASGIKIPLKYIGPLSRFEKKKEPFLYKLLVLLSGPEPQRTLLEEKLLKQLQTYNYNTLFVRGKVEDKQHETINNSLKIVNFLTSSDLEKAINSSEMVLCRSGYTTVMDLAKLEQKAFFIPTPGQFEQEYLAEKLMQDGIAPFCSQDNFKIELLNKIDEYVGFKAFRPSTNFETLFSLFKGK